MAGVKVGTPKGSWFCEGQFSLEQSLEQNDVIDHSDIKNRGDEHENEHWVFQIPCIIFEKPIFQLLLKGDIFSKQVAKNNNWF